MVSSAFTVDAVAISGAMEVEYGASVAVALTDNTGVHTVAWEIVGSSDSGLTDPTFADATAESTTFTMVADPETGQGASFGVKCTVTDSAGTSDATIAVVGVPNSPARIVPGYNGEETARDSTHGWLALVNTAIADNISYSATATTSDATVTTILSVALDDDTIYDCGCRVMTHDTAGADFHTLVRRWDFAYQRVNTGAPVKIIADSDGGVPVHRDDATWDAQVDLSANTMRIRITNDATNACHSEVQLWVTTKDISR